MLTDRRERGPFFQLPPRGRGHPPMVDDRGGRMKCGSKGLLGLLIAILAATPAPAFAGISAPTPRNYRNLRAIALRRSAEIQIALNAVEQKNAARWTAIARWLPRVELQLAQSRN